MSIRMKGNGLRDALLKLINDMGDKFNNSRKKRTIQVPSHSYNTRHSKKMRVSAKDDEEEEFNLDDYSFDDL